MEKDGDPGKTGSPSFLMNTENLKLKTEKNMVVNTEWKMRDKGAEKSEK